MGRFDGPHFRCEDRDVVSIWMAHTKLSAIPDDYLSRHPSDNDDDPWSTFSNNFGFGYYDDDCVESYLQNNKRAAPLYDQLKHLSYSSSFIDEAIAAAQKLSLVKTTFVYLIYNFDYDPSVTGIQKDDYLTFLGVFPYDRDSEPVELWTE